MYCAIQFVVSHLTFYGYRQLSEHRSHPLFVVIASGDSDILCCLKLLYSVVFSYGNSC